MKELVFTYKELHLDITYYFFNNGTFIACSSGVPLGALLKFPKKKLEYIASEMGTWKWQNQEVNMIAQKNRRLMGGNVKHMASRAIDDAYKYTVIAKELDDIMISE